MTALYLYAITDQPEAVVPARPGLVGGFPLPIPYRDIAAVVSPISTTRISPTESELWQHEGVIEALMRDRTVLPVRFGTVLTDHDAVQDILVAHYADFVVALERVRGRVELGLRVLWETSQLALAEGELPRKGPPNTMDGRAYLLARLEAAQRIQAWRRQAEELAAELHDPLSRLATESTRQVLLTPRLLLTAAYLIERTQVDIFRAGVEQLSAANPGLYFLCTGPWPPYSFVRISVA